VRARGPSRCVARWRGAVFLACLAALVLACEPEPGKDVVIDPSPQAISNQEGAVCGMLVRDQSAPRAQLLHRDGERAFLCSIGDLLAYLEVPSPHGAPVAIQVEVMDPAEDPLLSHPDPHPWVAAEEAVYVVGVARERIMGRPVMVYRDVADAQRAAAGASARMLDFTELKRWWAEEQGAS